MRDRLPAILKQWEPLMKRLIIAHDLTGRSTDALGRGIRLAACQGAALRVVHVAPDAAAPDTCPSAHRRLETEARIMAEELAGGAPDISVKILSGDPARAIGQEAGRFAADLVLLGAHGEPRLRDAIFGTTAMHLARDCARPILVVQTGHHLPYANVMIAVADKDSAEAPLRAAAALAPDAELFAVHAFEPTVAEILFRPLKAAGQRSDREEKLVGLAERLLPAGSARRCHVMAREGEVMEVLMKAWLDLAPALLVMGTHRRRGLSRLLIGNLSDPVLLACTSDILLVPAD